MQAIITKMHEPTKNYPSRVSARCDSGRIVMPWDFGLDTKTNHRRVAMALVRQLSWDQPGLMWCLGSLPGPAGDFVLVACEHS